MMIRSILHAAFACAGVFVVASAHAQSANPDVQKPAPAAAQTAIRPTPAGPVLHRQPRASDAPATADDAATSPLRETPDEAEMNRMIRNICRGC